MSRNFDDWILTFKETIFTSKYFVDFEKVHNYIETNKVEFAALNSLIGSRSIEADFDILINKIPSVINVIPLLLAVRKNEIKYLDNGDVLTYIFESNTLFNNDDYKKFMRDTGLFNLFEKHLISSVVDYATGVEVGSDTNARKNRSGCAMSLIVEKSIIDAGFVLNETYFKEIYKTDIESMFEIKISSENEDNKRFDFVLVYKNKIVAMEVNYYSSQGSKPSETSRSFRLINNESCNIKDFIFIWITDGFGWCKIKNNLRNSFNQIEHLYNINDLENGILNKVLKR
ncbi:MAG: type II restriction endonuclease [Firmicutes bacterium]|nr:type II restriction endonuclease [Bacillota bacterium]